jgi:hypothetical protein
MGIDMKDNVVVIGHYSVGAEINGEHLGQQLHTINDPLASMFIAFAGEAIGTTEKSPLYAARDAVVIGSFFEKDQSFPWFRHRITP